MLDLLYIFWSSLSATIKIIFKIYQLSDINFIINIPYCLSMCYIYADRKHSWRLIMKRGFKRLLSCIFIITLFLTGMCLDKAQTYSPEVRSFSVREAQMYATPEPSVNDSIPCTVEMLGYLKTSVSNPVIIRNSSRSLLRISHLIICALFTLLWGSIFINRTVTMQDNNTCRYRISIFD